MSLLGIDVGTTGCKAALFSETGQLLKAGYREYNYRRTHPGWAELDTLEVWQSVVETIVEAVSAADQDPVKALAVSSLGEAVVPVSRDRRPLGPSLLNFDARGHEYLPGLRALIDDVRCYAINGNPLGNHYSLTKLLWLKEHQPDLYGRTYKFLHWSGFVSYMLGADPVVDYSLANRTLLFDLENRDWSDELIEAAGLNREKLPGTVASGVVIGHLAQQVALELGLPGGIPIMSGGHDQCCNGVGCGVIEPGQAMLGMGTFLCIMPVYRHRPDSSLMIERGLNTEHHAVPGQFVSFIYNQGGALVKWFRDTFAGSEREQARSKGESIYPALFEEMPTGPSRLMVLPHFTTTGPPRFISESSGVIAGLKLETSRGDILKAILEGSTFYLRESLEALSPTGIAITGFRAAGGGSQSDRWVQTCADILGRPIARPKVNEAGALGAAILAGCGSGLWPTLKEGVDAMVVLDQGFSPDPEAARVYDQRFTAYVRLWPLLAEYLRDLDQF
jgi:xylulokinase